VLYIAARWRLTALPCYVTKISSWIVASREDKSAFQIKPAAGKIGERANPRHPPHVRCD
jgi:hypothetical protein